MYRILFVPLNLGHAKSMTSIINRLPNDQYEHLVINIDDSLEHVSVREGVKNFNLWDYKDRGTGAVFSDIRPDLIVLFNDISPMCRFLIEEARRQGVDSLLVQEGVKVVEPNFDMANFVRRNLIDLSLRLNEVVWGLRSESLGLMMDSFKTRIMKGYDYGHGSCDIIAASGPRFKRTLMEQGISGDRIVITGQPLYDSIINDSKERLAVLNVDNYTIGFATQPFVEFGLASKENYIKGLESILTILLRFDGARIFIKPHPSENVVDYQAIARKFGERVLIEENTDMKKYLEHLDLFVTYHSTTGLEAMLMGIPLVCIDLLGLGYADKIFGKEGLIARTPEELFITIQGIVTDPETYKASLQRQKVFLEDELYKLDGKSSVRVGELIQMMLKRRENS